MTHQVEIKVRFRAGHRLMEPYKGKCNNPHGEGYTAMLIFESDKLDENGMVIDFGKVKKHVQSIVDAFYDHSFMFNEKDKVGHLPELFYRMGFRLYLMKGNPTAENIARDLYDKVKLYYPALKRVGIIESFDDSIAWYEKEKLKENDNSSTVKIFDKEIDMKKLGDRFVDEARKMFQGIKLDTDIPEFNWNEKKCYNCNKVIPGFSEWCTFHFKKRRDFCSQKCYDKFNENYKKQKEIEDLKKPKKKEEDKIY
jgi:6-pyruvoyltetrahydropterin/6-carboxytetrahydropterin synthase